MHSFYEKEDCFGIGLEKRDQSVAFSLSNFPVCVIGAEVKPSISMMTKIDYNLSESTCRIAGYVLETQNHQFGYEQEILYV